MHACDMTVRKRPCAISVETNHLSPTVTDQTAAYEFNESGSDEDREEKHY